MTVHIVNEKDGMIIKTLHSYFEFKSWQAVQHKHYNLKSGLYGTFNVFVNQDEVVL